MRGGKLEHLRKVRIVNLEDPISGPDDDLTHLDCVSATAQEASDLQRLDWLGHEDLVIALVEGRKAAGVPQRAITYALNLGTIHNKATRIRLAAQGHTNEAIATLRDTTEGTIKNRRQRIRRWLTDGSGRAERRRRPGRGVGQVRRRPEKGGADSECLSRWPQTRRGFAGKPSTNLNVACRGPSITQREEGLLVFQRLLFFSQKPPPGMGSNSVQSMKLGEVGTHSRLAREH